MYYYKPSKQMDLSDRIFDYLEAGLGTECFRRLFGVILTDNGGEFKKVDELELNDDLEYS